MKSHRAAISVEKNPVVAFLSVRENQQFVGQCKYLVPSPIRFNLPVYSTPDLTWKEMEVGLVYIRATKSGIKERAGDQVYWTETAMAQTPWEPSSVGGERR